MAAPDGSAAPPPGLAVRPLLPSDLPAIRRIERQSYAPSLRESEPAFLSKMRLFPAGAVGCFAGDDLCGYAFALPWMRSATIGVAQVIDALPARPDVMYIHDMVVAPARRRQRVASTLLTEVLRIASALSFDRLALVAVQGSEPFWRRELSSHCTRPRPHSRLLKMP